MGKNVLFVIILLFSAITSAQVKEVNIDWKSIKNSEGRINLNEIKTWGGTTAKKEESFKYPSDICMDSKGNYYISDSGENEIVVFDKNGKFVKKIGQPGAGPGDLNFPVSIDIDQKDNLLVGEDGNRRIQVFSNGKSSFTMIPANSHTYRVRIDKKGRIALNDNSIANKTPFLNLFDFNKKPAGKIGVFNNNKNDKGIAAYYAKGRSFSIDKEGNYYLGNSYGKPVIEKYSPDGKLLMKINYQLSAPPEEIKERGGTVTGGGGTGLRALEVDGEGNIFALVLKKAIPKEDQKYLGGMMMSGGRTSGQMNIQVIPPKERKDKFDNYALIIFDKNGQLLGLKSVDFYVDHMRVSAGNVFLLNSYVDSVIHQYKFSR